MFAAVVVCTACFDVRDPASDEPRLLDRACASEDDCATTGSALRTTGITADSVGYRLGPDEGSVTIPLERIASDEFVFELLVTGEGAISVSSAGLGISENLELGSDYDWKRVSGKIPSGSDAGSFDNPFELTLAVSDGSHADIADIRAVGLDYPSSCAVRTPGR